MKNREIKFRVWDNVDYMSKPFTLQSLMGANRTEFTSDCIVMQYTGTKDCNGKEIYEGDVVRCMSRDYKGEEHECIELVGMGDWSNGVQEDNLTYTGPHLRGLHGLTSSWYGHLTHDKAERCEIVGNAYENPELLK